MNIELPAALEAELAAAAEDDGIPVDEAVERAVAEWVRRRREHRAHVRALIHEIMTEDARLLARLGDA